MFNRRVYLATRDVMRGSRSSSKQRHQLKWMIAIKRQSLNGSEEDTWLHWRLWFHIGRSRFWLTVETRGWLTSFRSPSNGPRHREIGRLAHDCTLIAPRSQLNPTAILARSRRDRGAVEPRSWLLRGEIVAHDLPTLVGHDCHQIVATNRLLTGSNGHDFRVEFSFKNWCIPFLFFNFWSIREVN